MARQMRRVLPRYDTILEVLEDSIKNGKRQHTTLLVCLSKEEFLLQIITSIHVQRRSEDTALAVPEEGSGNVEQDGMYSAKQPHPLLIPTLHLLSTSQNIRFVFCSTITIFRAYISVGISPPATTNQGHMPSELIVLNLLALHHGTSEFTLQGLSRTVASLVSATHRSKHDLRLIECKDAQDLTDPDRGAAVWNAQIPLLSGSVKIAGAGASWARRSMSVRKVIERWFEFEEET